MSGKTAAPSSSSNSKATKPRKYFFHWYQIDFHRTIAVLVGSPEAAVPEIHRSWKKRAYADAIADTLRELESQFDYEHLIANRSGAAKAVGGGGTVVAWFPAIPTDPVLVHELLHCVQMTAENLNIEDWEYEANLLEIMFDHFQKRLHKDATLPFEPKEGAIIED